MSENGSNRETQVRETRGVVTLVDLGSYFGRSGLLRQTSKLCCTANDVLFTLGYCTYCNLSVIVVACSNHKSQKYTSVRKTIPFIRECVIYENI